MTNSSKACVLTLTVLFGSLAVSSRYPSKDCELCSSSSSRSGTLQPTRVSGSLDQWGVTSSCALSIEEPLAVDRVPGLRARPETLRARARVLAGVAAAVAPERSPKIQRAVMQCVLNRVGAEGFPSTLKEVVYQKGQWPRWSESLEPDGATVRLATELLEEQDNERVIVIPSNCVYMKETENSLIFRSDWEVSESTDVCEIFY